MSGMPAASKFWRITKVVRHGLVTCLAIGTSAVVSAPMHADFRCGGPVEREIWQLWDGSAREMIRRDHIRDRLQKNGDAYALYDVQTYLQNLASMAARCGRLDKLQDLAGLLALAYDSVEGLPGHDQRETGWLCKGGRTCSGDPRLKDSEVVLISAQFLVLTMRVAAALTESPAWPQSRHFVERSARLTAAHLHRWVQGVEPLRLAERLASKAADVRDGSSRLFFTADDLWMITLYAELAGVLAARPELRTALPQSALDRPMREGLAGLLALWRSRVKPTVIESQAIGRETGADLDRGYWRLHRDSRYAGYAGAESPARCAEGGNPSEQRVLADTVPVVKTVGWDLSHARRLVHALDAVERNRVALQAAYAVPTDLLPESLWPRQFAGQLAGVVWSGDTKWPLFSNYWDGTNGWYRVAYASGGGCFEGYPPWGLSEAFATGGFVTWGRHHPVLGELGERLYRMSRSDSPDVQAFLATNYGPLSSGSPVNTRLLTQLMFWPSLVQWSNKS